MDLILTSISLILGLRFIEAVCPGLSYQQFSLILPQASDLHVVVGHGRRRGDRRRVLRRAHYAAVHRAHVASYAGRAAVASDHVLVHSPTPGAHQDPGHRERHQQPGADHQEPQEELQGQDQFSARLAEVHDTTRTGLPVRILHQPGPGNDSAI